MPYVVLLKVDVKEDYFALKITGISKLGAAATNSNGARGREIDIPALVAATPPPLMEWV